MQLITPFFRPDLTEGDIQAVVETLRSGWLTTGPRVRAFEAAFATAVGARHAVALNSGTAALHLAVEALGLEAGAAALVPTLTFAATAEVIRYRGAVPLLVDCEAESLNMDLADADRKMSDLASGRLPGSMPVDSAVRGILPVHVGGEMMDLAAVGSFASRHGLWVVEDAAHAFPAARRDANGAWRRCGEGTADVTCFSFYANKTLTTGEGGMAVTDRAELAERMRLMSLHGLSQDAWGRYSGGGTWDYRIIAPGFKYNLTDPAAALGLSQLARADDMQARRERIARAYRDTLDPVEEIELPRVSGEVRHAWHLFPIRLRLEKLTIDRATFIEALGTLGVRCSVHWRPLHLHPYYQKEFGWRPEHFPVATREWERLVSLPLFPSLTDEEMDRVTSAVRDVCRRHRVGVRHVSA